MLHLDYLADIRAKILLDIRAGSHCLQDCLSLHCAAVLEKKGRWDMRHFMKDGFAQNGRRERTILLSLVIILAAQLNIKLLFSDFKISIAAVCYPGFLLLIDDFSYYGVALGSSFGVMASRMIVYYVQNGSFHGAVASCSPELIFYLSYSLFIWIYIEHFKHKKLLSVAGMFPIVVIDYAANLLELFCRVQADTFLWSAQLGIFSVALFRTGFVWCILTAFEQYTLLLMKKEHEKRYQHLLLLISKLNDEVLWMKKNASQIEDTMRTAYLLYEDLKETEADSERAKDALKIARDIHEIKKEYFLIMRGLSTAMEEEDDGDGMYLSEIFRLLKDTMSPAAEENGRRLELTIDCKDALYTKKQYFFLSIFRNLLMNAIEASKEKEVLVEIREKKEEKYYCFTVTDHGPGIPKEDQEEVFKAGYSTKINYHTGEINRGLGLNLVKNLTEQQLFGQILLSSCPGTTTFTIKIPVKEL